MALPDFTEFLARDFDLLLGPAAKYRVMFRVAFGPLALHKCMGSPGVERIVTHRYDRLLNFGIAKEIGPVIQVVDLDSLAGDNFGRASRCRRKREDEKLMVVGNLPMRTRAGFPQAGVAHFARAGAEGRMA